MVSSASGAEFLRRSDVKDVSPNEYRRMFGEFLRERCLKQVQALLLDPNDDLHHSVYASAQDLLHHDPCLGYMFLHNAALLVPIMNEALLQLQLSFMKNEEFVRSHAEGCTVKHNCHVRFVDLPPVEEHTKHNIGAIRSCDFGNLLQLSGTVVRTGMVKMLEVSKEYQCQKPRCKHRFRVYADMEQGNTITVPRLCPGGDENSPCKGTQLREVEGSRVCSDYQEIKLQDQVQRLAVGQVPRSVLILLEDDLVDKCKAGDDVIVVGPLERRWRPLRANSSMHVDIYLRAMSIQVRNNALELTPVSGEGFFGVSTGACVQQFEAFWKHFVAELDSPLKGRNVIMRSVCPQIYGLAQVKLAVLLTLIGGVGGVPLFHNQEEQHPHIYSASADAGVDVSTGESVRRRGQSHLLLVGDPGTGKSQFLKFACSVSARAVFTTGVGTTAAGLTCSAVREVGGAGTGDGWALEAGALVLADRGVCCIDEFSSIREHDRTCIHEAMEQQTLSIAKAGLVCKLNTRTTVFAVTNPKGSYDVTQDLTTNTALGGPLLSRFDLILVLLDTPNKDWDKRVSTFILREAMDDGGESQIQKQSQTDVREHSKRHVSKSAPLPQEGLTNVPFWPLETLRQYIVHVQTRFFPVLTSEAESLLVNYYQYQRMRDDRSYNCARTTVRLLESLVRLSQAHARLMYRDDVQPCDALAAIELVETSMHTSSVLQMESVLHRDFDDDPDLQLKHRLREVTQKLKLGLKFRTDGLNLPHETLIPQEDFGNPSERNVNSKQGYPLYGECSLAVPEITRTPAFNPAPAIPAIPKQIRQPSPNSSPLFTPKKRSKKRAVEIRTNTPERQDEGTIGLKGITPTPHPTNSGKTGSPLTSVQIKSRAIKRMKVTVRRGDASPAGGVSDPVVLPASGSRLANLLDEDSLTW